MLKCSLFLSTTAVHWMNQSWLKSAHAFFTRKCKVKKEIFFWKSHAWSQQKLLEKFLEKVKRVKRAKNDKFAPCETCEKNRCDLTVHPLQQRFWYDEFALGETCEKNRRDLTVHTLQPSFRPSRFLFCLFDFFKMLSILVENKW